VIRYAIEDIACVKPCDGYISICAPQNYAIRPKETKLIGTGLRVAIPYGYDGGLYVSENLLNKNVILVNWIGTIDSDYRGEIKFILKNLSDSILKIDKGELLGRLSIIPVFQYNNLLPTSDTMPKIEIRLEPGCRAPAYQTEGASGADLAACIKEPINVDPYSVIRIPTGVTVEIPEGYELQVRPRSGLAAKHDITIVPQFYRGHSIVSIEVFIVNLGSSQFIISPGDRIAQMVVIPVSKNVFIEVTQDELDQTQRGEHGFGSTGRNYSA